MHTELLAPAGDWDAMRAAVANGADAVYFGLTNHNARHRAANFHLVELPKVMGFLHDHNVRGYVTINTLAFSDELPEIVEVVREVAKAGADAVIVQDFGLARLIHAIAPTLPIHGSTQMTLTEPRGLERVRGDLGVERVILARELSLADVARIRQATTLPVEVFVHGALCVSYSGQCLTSESFGGRSANRGQCAQACRQPYDLIVDGQTVDMEGRSYLLSPRDLASADVMDEVVAAGVAAVKIEGRLKSAHYVAAATQTYRAALDAALAGKPVELSSQQRMDLQQSFSRGFAYGFLKGVNHQELVEGKCPKHRGVRAAVVVGVSDHGVIVRYERGMTLKPGDGVVFDEGHPEQDEQGGRIYAINRAPKWGGVELVLGHGAINFGSVAKGATVWRTDDPTIRKRLERSVQLDGPVHRAPLHVAVTAVAGQPLQLIWRDEAGNEVSIVSEQAMEAARQHPLTVELLTQQLGRLGETPYELASVTLNGGEDATPVMVPKSVLNDLRRRSAEKLIALRQQRQPHAATSRDVLAEMRRRIATQHRNHDNSLHLTVLARSLAQVDAAAAWRGEGELAHVAMIYCEFEDVKRYGEAVRVARDAGVPVALATTRIIKPGEESLLRQIAACEPDAVLARNLAGLAFFHEEKPRMPLIADYSLNIANELTAQWLSEQGVARMVPSYDLNWRQMLAMFERFGAGMFEAVVHQQMPMFHMEHCVFAATLSQGRDHRTCGRPCEKHHVELRDHVGVAHPLLADVGCRNTVHNGQAQSAANYLPAMRDAGLTWFRVELMRQAPGDTSMLLNHYANMLVGREQPVQARRQLRVLNQLGVTAGTLEHD
ncbi:MAG: U32 family peptidase [Phycisphaeraceae bacterium]|nr:U32 family peptidase [Phycisphaeraceae bacterium]